MILRPLEFLYQLISSTRNIFYENEWIDAVQVDKPVISIGNLAFGGTGKTPFIIFLVEALNNNEKIAVISKSYKALLKSPEQVNLKLLNASQRYGDEACLIQKKLPNVVVWSGPKKYLTAQASLASHPEMMIIDDGFSHRKLKRNFDLVLIDASKISNTYYRENLSSLKRCHAVVFTKMQDADLQQIEKLKLSLLSRFPHLQESIFSSANEINLNLTTDHELFVFCGLAQPDSFRLSLEKKNYKIKNFSKYQDHQNYTDDLQNEILSQFLILKKDYPALELVTTEKDAVKINNSDLIKRMHIVDYKLTMPTKDKESLIEKIRKII